MLKDTLNRTHELMKKSVERMQSEFTALRTNRANPAIVDGIKVEVYNSMMPLNQLAGIAVSDAKTIEIKPWDAATLPMIEKAILSSSLGITPLNDGKVLRLKIPPMTEDRRRELVKVAHKLAEDFRVSVRNERHQALEFIKKEEKDKKISQDERFKAEEQLQKSTDAFIKAIDEIAATKEKEILSD